MIYKLAIVAKEPISTTIAALRHWDTLPAFVVKDIEQR